MLSVTVQGSNRLQCPVLSVGGVFGFRTWVSLLCLVMLRQSSRFLTLLSSPWFLGAGVLISYVKVSIMMITVTSSIVTIGRFVFLEAIRVSMKVT